MNPPDKTSIPRNSRKFQKGITEVYFGEKAEIDTVIHGVWNPAYRYQRRLLTFPFWPVFKIIQNENKIENIAIDFTPNYYVEFSPGRSPEARPHDWLKSTFWIKQKLYPATKEKRIEDVFTASDCKNKHPFDNDFESIFLDIYTICLTHEGRTTIKAHDYINFIWILRYLIQNAVVFPVKNLDFKEWQCHARGYLEEAHALFPENLINEKHLRGWNIEEENDFKNVEEIFISDMRYLLNLLLEALKNDSGIEIFLNKIILAFAEELNQKEILKTCAFCRRLMFYSEQKIYCSLKTEGKDCGKKARNKKYYITKGQARLPKYRETTRELRKYYKSKGIKK